MIAVIDYGMGNLRSVEKALHSIGADARVTGRPQDIARAERIVLPGVGSFPDAMRELDNRGLISPIGKAIASGKPYLGICLGLQLLFERSGEDGGAGGMAILKGDVRKFKPSGLKVPHMGWNGVSIVNKECRLFNGIEDNSYFYFVHSYFVKPDQDAIIAAATDYGGDFASMVWKDNIFAVQFHPEKSQAAGIRFLKNFIGI